MSVWQRLSDNPNPFNPCLDYLETLVALMCGGTRPVYFRPLHFRLHYFDPEARRPGVPPDVGALVDEIGTGHLCVHLVNIDHFRSKTVLIQGGVSGLCAVCAGRCPSLLPVPSHGLFAGQAYAEHQIESVELDGQSHEVGGTHFTVRVAPGAGARLRVGLTRYVNEPTALFPWMR